MPAKKTTPKKTKKALKRPTKLTSKTSKRLAPKKVDSKKSATLARSKQARKKPGPRRAPAKNAAPKAARKKTSKETPPRRGRRDEVELAIRQVGAGSDIAGQSGDVQGLPKEELVDTESVEELAEEGQGFEAAFVDGVENAPDADQAEVTTKEVPEDDVPPEYLDNK